MGARPWLGAPLMWQASDSLSGRGLQVMLPKGDHSAASHPASTSYRVTLTFLLPYIGIHLPPFDSRLILTYNKDETLGPWLCHIFYLAGSRWSGLDPVTMLAVEGTKDPGHSQAGTEVYPWPQPQPQGATSFLPGNHVGLLQPCGTKTRFSS